MCGINGYLNINGEAPKELDILYSKLNKMNELIKHRGPDSDGIYQKGPVGLGFRRLSIIDLHDIANQPMLDEENELALIFNGEIYNYIELRKELIDKGHTFKTQSDTEVILKSYREYGENCVSKFNGMWAFAIYDFKEQKLFCSRDRLGVKPFYYTQKNGLLYFSSELKALHFAADLTKANHAKVYEYLAYGYRVNDGETFFDNCNELLPGTNMIIKKGEIQLVKYWELKPNLYNLKSNENIEDQYLNLLQDAIKIRFRSDVPVGILLSGGLDSTSIAKITDELIEDGKLGNSEVHAYTASFPNFKDDETGKARELVATCKYLKLHEMLIDTAGVSQNIEDMLKDFDHPVFSFATIAHNNIMKACKKEGITVVLNGQGSDEAYAGYIQYIVGVFLIDLFFKSPVRFLKEFKALRKVNGYSYSFLTSQMVKGLMNKSKASYVRAKYIEKSFDVLDKDFVASNYGHFKSGFKFSRKQDNFSEYLLNQINYTGINGILHYEDVSSMNQSIEIRSPFMDYRLMEFAFSIPNHYKFQFGESKKIQRDTIGKRLPDSISKERKKIGFSTPFVDYLTTDKDFKLKVSEILNTDSFNSKKIWNPDDVREKFDDPTKNPNFPYWRFLNLEIWAKAYNVSNL